MKNNLDKQRFAYEVLLQRIVSGRYGPGYRLVIDQIAQELRISPTPVREAIRRLEAEGIVTSSRHSGARVALINDRTYTEALSLLAVLEGYATALAAMRLTANQLQTLWEINEAMRKTIKDLDFEQFNTLNRSFHRTIYLASGNSYLTEMLENTCKRLDTVRRNIFAFLPGRAPKSVEEHETLLRMIREGASPERIEQVARQHKLNMLQAFLAWRARSRESNLGILEGSEETLLGSSQTR